MDPRGHNLLILGGDLNTTGADNAPMSVSKVLTDRVKDDESNRFHFEDGHVFDFRGESERSAEGRGGSLSDSNQRSGKGFRYTFALAKTYGGLIGEFKLDWFFVKGLATDSRKPGGKYQFAPHFGRTLMELNYAPNESLSDHTPLIVDIPLTEPPPRATSP